MRVVTSGLELSADKSRTQSLLDNFQEEKRTKSHRRGKRSNDPWSHKRLKLVPTENDMPDTDTFDILTFHHGEAKKPSRRFLRWKHHSEPRQRQRQRQLQTYFDELEEFTTVTSSPKVKAFHPHPALYSCTTPTAKALGYTSVAVDAATVHQLGSVAGEAVVERVDTGGHCIVCFEPASAVPTFHAGCGHGMCVTCWQEYARVAMEDRQRWTDTNGRTAATICCAMPGCIMPAPDALLRRALTTTAFAALLELRADAIVHKDTSLAYCPKSTCSAVVRTTSIAPPDKYKCSPCTEPCAEATCSACGSHWCPSCGEAPHWPASCAERRIFFATYGDQVRDAPTRPMDQSGQVKMCPSCCIPIEKAGGCSHMRCTKCRADFCWTCGQHNGGRGGNYHPNPCVANPWELSLTAWATTPPANIDTPVKNALPIALHFITTASDMADRRGQIRGGLARGPEECRRLGRLLGMGANRLRLRLEPDGAIFTGGIYSLWADRQLSNRSLLHIVEAAHDTARAVANAHVALTVLQLRSRQGCGELRVQVMQLLGQPSTLEFSRRIEAVERVTERLVHILVHFQGRTMSNHECQKLADKAMRSLRNLEAAHATWRHESRRVRNSTQENPWAVDRAI